MFILHEIGLLSIPLYKKKIIGGNVNISKQFNCHQPIKWRREINPDIEKKIRHIYELWKIDRRKISYELECSEIYLQKDTNKFT